MKTKNVKLVPLVTLICVFIGLGGCTNTETEESKVASQALETDTGYVPGPDDFVAVEETPEMIYEEPTEYPREAKEQGLEGTVWLKSLVDENGEALKVILGQSSGNAQLDSAAIVAGYENKYSPGIQDGKPVKVWVTYKVEFRLDG